MNSKLLKIKFIALLVVSICSLSTLLVGCNAPEQSDVPVTDNISTYSISYHVVEVYTFDGEMVANVDYLGTWKDFWLQYSALAKLNLPTEYTAASEDIVFPAMHTEEMYLYGMNPPYNYQGTLSEWYTDKYCTTLFSGKITKDTTGNIELYSKWTLTFVGPV